jgi:UDP-GlcNAc3NAcA epimerase
LKICSVEKSLRGGAEKLTGVCMKVMTVIGARPQFVKAAVVSRAFKEHRKDVQEVIVHTGQHYDANMSDVFFDDLKIPKPDFNLGIGGGSHGQNTGRMLEKIEALIINESPDCVLVYGDTDSTLAGALAASKLHVPVAHVEAGLRSFNKRMPEEINRILTDHMSTLLLAPTNTAKENLLREGIADEKVFLTGDVMCDASLFYKEMAKVPNEINPDAAYLSDFILCTIHRAENTDDPVRLEQIFRGLGGCDKRVILPLHPRTRAKISRFGLNLPSNVSVIDPVGYLEMVWLEIHCSAIATDSGGVQKEAYFFGKPCVTLRDETEWVELVQSGWNVLAGADEYIIKSSLFNAKTPETSRSLYGNGASALEVVSLISKLS